jgi:hypothetical protein
MKATKNAKMQKSKAVVLLFRNSSSGIHEQHPGTMT